MGTRGCVCVCVCVCVREREKERNLYVCLFLQSTFLFIHLSICICAHSSAIDEHFRCVPPASVCVHVSLCFAMYVQNYSALFSRHSCNWTGLMCNPSRHFKGREAWTDVVLLVYQMGLYDEKSVIPIQASLPSLVHYKAIHSFFLLQGIISLFFHSPKHTIVFFSFLSSFSCFLSISVFITPSSHPSVSSSLCISLISLFAPHSPTLPLLLKTCKCGIS